MLHRLALITTFLYHCPLAAHPSSSYAFSLSLSALIFHPLIFSLSLSFSSCLTRSLVPCHFSPDRSLFPASAPVPGLLNAARGRMHAFVVQKKVAQIMLHEREDFNLCIKERGFNVKVAVHNATWFKIKSCSLVSAKFPLSF